MWRKDQEVGRRIRKPVQVQEEDEEEDEDED
jgi:hypothetical protein